MNLPAFTAEASLQDTSSRCRSLTSDSASPKRRVVIPQLGGRGFKGFQGCKSDCLDKHPTWTGAQCERSCRDPGHAGASPDTSFNDFLSSAGIGAWEIGCRLNPFSPPGACGWLGNVMRGQS